MRNKIFKSIFLSCVIALVSACVVFVAYFYNTLSRLSDGSYNFLSMLGEIIAPLIMLIAGMTLIAFAIASGVSRTIIRPINEIDPENPTKTKTYDELSPIVAKLVSQNYRISRQMDTLRIRENEFNSITFNMSEGIVVINSRAAILSCNRSAKEIFDVQGEVPHGILSLNDSEGFRAAVHAALNGSNGYHTIRKGEKYYSVFATPVLHERYVEGAVILIIDETEKEAREALRREFTSNISHELKTPLTSISGFAEIIKSGMATDEDTVHFAENIHKEASRLISLVGDIIRLSQLDGGEIPYDDGGVNLYEVASEVADRLMNVADTAGVSIEACGEPLTVPGNYTIIEEIIYNLADNAIKYNRKGGFVKITVYADSDRATVSVTDNGIGIPADKKDRVFERFYRVDKSHSRKIGGTGLGLSIVKHAAAYHKAVINMESQEGVGTTVTVSFPFELRTTKIKDK